MEIDLKFSVQDLPRQGDLLALSRFRERHPFDRFGMLLTPDCDLQHAFPFQTVSFLRVVSVPDYVSHVWARKKVLAQFAKSKADAAGLINRINRERDATRSEINEDAVVEWVHTASVEEICAEIGAQEVEVVAKITNSITRVKSCRSAIPNSDTDAALDSLVTLRANGGDTKKAKAEVLKQAGGELAKEADEVFFLSRLTEDEANAGYYILLDQISSIRRDHLLSSQTDADKIPDGAHRFGRLEKTITYAVVQRFALLFQKIGLPDVRKANLQAALQKLE